MLSRSIVIVSLVGLVALTVDAQQVFELASAQVVESTDRPPVLKLAATGPIAFAVESPSDGSPAAGTLKVRLYGVYPGTGHVFGTTTPFSVAVERLDDGARLTVTTAVSTGEELRVQSGARSNELLITVSRSRD